MKNAGRMYYYLIFLLLILVCNGNLILPNDTIKISSNQMHNNLIYSVKYHLKQQQPRIYTLQGYSETFHQITGLRLAFQHTQALLYKIRFEGKCYSRHSTEIWLFLHLMINDYLLYVDKLLPNAANRFTYLGCGSNDDGDQIGGLYWHANSVTVIPCSFNDIIYLNGGLHVIHVGVRGRGTFPIDVEGGILTIELVEYDPEANIGMSPVNVTSTRLIG